MAPDRRGRRALRVTSTVRFRITALATLAVGLVLGVTAIGLVVAQRRALTDDLDESLAAEAEAIVERIEGGTDPADVRLAGPAVDDDAVAQVVVDGRVVATSEREVPDPVAPGPDDAAARTVDVTAADDDEDEPYRVAVPARGRRVGHGRPRRGAARRRRRERRARSPARWPWPSRS